MTATETKERPILFKGRLVRAILNGTKTQTRRVERLQDIREEGAIAEGIEPVQHYANPNSGFYTFNDGLGESRGAVEAFRALWDLTTAKGRYGWDANPWVWVVSFKRIDGGDS